MYIFSICEMLLYLRCVVARCHRVQDKQVVRAWSVLWCPVSMQLSTQLHICLCMHVSGMCMLA
jgi:hypothetical protein